MKRPNTTIIADFDRLALDVGVYEVAIAMNAWINKGLDARNESIIKFKDEIDPTTFSKELHITEQKYPEQTKRFREILDEMYQVHLSKNADYSPMNILGVGVVGIVTRIWDKTSRICSLLGWNLQTGEYSSERKSTNDESIEDNLKDLGVYSIIARIYREGKWGK